MIVKQKTESRKQKAESRKQKAESRKQKAESRKQKAESNYDLRDVCGRRQAYARANRTSAAGGFCCLVLCIPARRSG